MALTFPIAERVAVAYAFRFAFVIIMDSAYLARLMVAIHILVRSTHRAGFSSFSW
jgi:hypothetical protein